MALSRYYTVFQGILNLPSGYDSYTTTLAEQPNFDSLDSCKDKWLKNPNAQINIQSMIVALEGKNMFIYHLFLLKSQWICVILSFWHKKF